MVNCLAATITTYFLFLAATAGCDGGNQWWGLLPVVAAVAVAVDDVPVVHGSEIVGVRGRGPFSAGGVGARGGGRGRGAASDLPWGSVEVSGKRNAMWDGVAC